VRTGDVLARCVLAVLKNWFPCPAPLCVAGAAAAVRCRRAQLVVEDDTRAARARRVLLRNPGSLARRPLLWVSAAYASLEGSMSHHTTVATAPQRRVGVPVGPPLVGGSPGG